MRYEVGNPWNAQNAAKPFKVIKVLDNGQRSPIFGNYATFEAAQKKADTLNKELGAM